MSNRFFDWVASASRFISYTWARAAEVNASLDNVSTGFTLAQAEIDENKTRSSRELAIPHARDRCSASTTPPAPLAGRPDHFAQALGSAISARTSPISLRQASWPRPYFWR